MIALCWPSIQAWNRRRAFKRLIIRELEDLRPNPPDFERGLRWVDHQKREPVHKRILDDPSEHRDFILSLPFDLLQYVTRLWAARQEEDGRQWIAALTELSRSKYDKRGCLKENAKEWQLLILTYEKYATGMYSI